MKTEIIYPNHPCNLAELSITNLWNKQNRNHSSQMFSLPLSWVLFSAEIKIIFYISTQTKQKTDNSQHLRVQQLSHLILQPTFQDN